jgi:hypothetical protein
MSRIPLTTALLSVGAALLLLAACGGDDTTGPTNGSIQVSVTSTGEPADPTGYTVAVDGGAGHAITAGGTVTISDLSAGPHTVMLGDLAQNCSTAAGTNPQTVTVAAGETAQVAFAVICAPLPPAVTTLPATGVTASSVALNGTVNPNGSPTTWTFEVGTTTHLGEECAEDGEPVTGTADVAASCSITGQPAGQTIYYRLVAANAAGRAEGEILSVVTTAAPAITSLTFPATVSNDAGTSVDLTIGFTDPDGDVAVLRYEEVSDPNDAVTIDPDTADVRSLAAGRTSGTFTIQAAYTCADPDGCVTGPVTVRLRLRDEAGHESEPSDLSFEIRELRGGSVAGGGTRSRAEPTLSVKGRWGLFQKR